MLRSRRDRGNTSVVCIRVDGFDDPIIIEDGRNIKDWKRIRSELSEKSSIVRDLVLRKNANTSKSDSSQTSSPEASPRETTHVIDPSGDSDSMWLLESSNEWLWDPDPIL